MDKSMIAKGKVDACRKDNHATKKPFDVKRMVTLGLLSAIGVILVLLVHFPILPTAPFLQYDPADVPILIGAIAFGPAAGIVMTVIVSVMQTLLVGSGSGIIGCLMHILATGSMAFAVGMLYKHSKKTIPSLMFALAVGCVVMTGMMILMNLVFTPLFMGVERKVVMGMLIPTIIPFNLLKSAINSTLAFVLGKSLTRVGVFRED